MNTEQNSLYDPSDIEGNIKNGYMIQTKDRFLGATLVLGFGFVGALYLGWKPAKELFFANIGFLICLGIGVFVPFMHIGTFIFGLGSFILPISYIIDKEHYCKLTPAGKIEDEKYNVQMMKEVDEDISAMKVKAGKVLKNLSEKLSSSEVKSVESSEIVNPHNKSKDISTNIYCHDCGEKLVSEARFCTGCGCKQVKAA